MKIGFRINIIPEENVLYSDDFLILAKDSEETKKLKDKISNELKLLELSLNLEKTQAGKVEEGFGFLGYEFNERGSKIPKKAMEHLEERLEDMWLLGRTLTLQEKLEKALEIQIGWEQYYRGEKEPENIVAFLVSLHVADRHGEPVSEDFLCRRKKIHNIYEDICVHLADIWTKTGRDDLLLFEYEDFYGWQEPENYEILKERKRLLEEIFACYENLQKKQRIEISEEYKKEELFVEIMQLYADAGLYSVAEKINHFIRKNEEKKTEVRSVPLQPEQQGEVLIKDINFFMNLFAGREDMYAEEKEIHGHRKYEMVMQPLTVMEMRSHLAGERTIGTYVQRSNATAHFLVFDIDISKRVLLANQEMNENFIEYYKMAGEYVKELLKVFKMMGLMGYPEESGYRGYHVWLFCEGWISVRYLNTLADEILKRLSENENIQVEIFPNKTHLKHGKAGQVIKLPYGLHLQTGRQGYLCGEDLRKVEDADRHMRGIVCYSLNEIKRVIGKVAGYQPREKEERKFEIEENELVGLNQGIVAVLKHCSLMRYLYVKSKRTGYLTHGERLSVLYVFGHLGEEGKNFIHAIMEFTMNYQYHVTQKFIERLPEKPVSCTKLREQYRKITAEYGCSCNFKRSKNCYPSPVLHAAKISNEEKLDVTVPVPRKISKETEEKIREELNLPRNVLMLAKKLQDLKKQKRGVEKAVQKTEMELSQIFDGVGVDCMEIDLGLLCRRKTENGVEWVIEL